MVFSFSLIVLANAQNTDSVKVYEYSDGIDIAKSSGRPIAIDPLALQYTRQESAMPKTKAEINNFILINPTQFVNDLILPDKDIDGKTTREQLEQRPDIDIVLKNQTIFLILDSNGKEIVRIVGKFDVGRYFGKNKEQYEGDSSTLIYLIRLDADKKEIGNYKVSNVDLMDKQDTFFSDTYKYAENKKGKIQRLPQEVGLISIKDLKTASNAYNTNYYSNFVTISGIIRDIKSVGNSYQFAIDDGTGVITLYGYTGGLGDIKEGDKVFSKIIEANVVLSVSKNPIPTNSNPVKSSEGGSNVKAPGFEAILAISIIGALWLRKKIKGVNGNEK